MATKLSLKEVKNVLEKYFHVIPAAVQQLYGFYCLNFKISMQNGERNHDQSFIMKFIDSACHHACANLDLQHKMMRHLNQDRIATSQPVSIANGQTIVDYIGDDGKEYKVQLLTFLEGVPIVEADLTAHEMEKISSDVGKLVGRMHKSLMFMKCDANDLDFNTYNEFHVENALSFRPKLAYVADEQLRLMMAKYLDLFEKTFIPWKQELRKVFAHADISDGNMIIHKVGKDWELAGVIDFEDSHFGYLVGDFGVCVAYMMMRAGSIENCDIIEVSRRIVQSYEQVVPLTTTEREILFEVVTSRAVVSYATGCFKSHNEPENREYLFRQSRSVPSVLRAIDEVGKDHLLDVWFRK